VAACASRSDERGAQPLECVTAKLDQPPWAKCAVIGDPGGRCNQRDKLGV
jgi:hypothetical protein